MKILSKKQAGEALRRITALQIMANHQAELQKGRDAAETLQKATEHLVELAYIVGGVQGIDKVSKSIRKWEGNEDE